MNECDDFDGLDDLDDEWDDWEDEECEEPEPVTFFTVSDTWPNVPLNPLSACADPADNDRPAAPAASTRPARSTQRRTPAPAASRDSSLRRHPWPPRPDVSIPALNQPLASPAVDKCDLQNILSATVLGVAEPAGDRLSTKRRTARS
ncbi:hypothetical protein GCM10009593_09770 [Microlunatus antarcticus]